MGRFPKLRYHSTMGGLQARQTAWILCLLSGCAKPSQAPLTSVVPVIGLPPIPIDLTRPGLDVRPMATAEAVAAVQPTVRVDAAVEEAMIERRPVRLGYPAEAAQRRLSGHVVFRIIVARDGTVEGLTLIETTNNLFIPIATASVQSWQYKPYLLNGKPTAVDTQVRLDFEPPL